MLNNLIYETSPYLIQHKNNPVNCYVWNKKTLDHVRVIKRTVLLSIAYSSCYWCQVIPCVEYIQTAHSWLLNYQIIVLYKKKYFGS